MFVELLGYSDVGLFILRLAVGIIFIVHAVPKFTATAGMAQGIGAPASAVLLLGSVELLSAAGLIVGIYPEIAAILLSIVMLGAIWMKITKWHIGFAAQNTTGWEFDFLLLASNIVILLTGGGAVGVL